MKNLTKISMKAITIVALTTGSVISATSAPTGGSIRYWSAECEFYDEEYESSPMYEIYIDMPESEGSSVYYSLGYGKWEHERYSERDVTRLSGAVGSNKRLTDYSYTGVAFKINTTYFGGGGSTAPSHLAISTGGMYALNLPISTSSFAVQAAVAGEVIWLHLYDDIDHDWRWDSRYETWESQADADDSNNFGIGIQYSGNVAIGYSHKNIWGSVGYRYLSSSGNDVTDTVQGPYMEIGCQL